MSIKYYIDTIRLTNNNHAQRTFTHLEGTFPYENGKNYPPYERSLLLRLCGKEGWKELLFSTTMPEVKYLGKFISGMTTNEEVDMLFQIIDKSLLTDEFIDSVLKDINSFNLNTLIYSIKKLLSMKKGDKFLTPIQYWSLKSLYTSNEKCGHECVDFIKESSQNVDYVNGIVCLSHVTGALKGIYYRVYKKEYEKIDALLDILQLEDEHQNSSALWIGDEEERKYLTRGELHILNDFFKKDESIKAPNDMFGYSITEISKYVQDDLSIRQYIVRRVLFMVFNRLETAEDFEMLIQYAPELHKTEMTSMWNAWNMRGKKKPIIDI